MLERVDRGEATPMDLDIMASVQENIIGNCLCVLGDSMAMPVGSLVREFRTEFETHLQERAAHLQADGRVSRGTGMQRDGEPAHAGPARAAVAGSDVVEDGLPAAEPAQVTGGDEVQGQPQPTREDEERGRR
jgi:hypothetical protein